MTWTARGLRIRPARTAVLQAWGLPAAAAALRRI